MAEAHITVANEFLDAIPPPAGDDVFALNDLAPGYSKKWVSLAIPFASAFACLRSAKRLRVVTKSRSSCTVNVIKSSKIHSTETWRLFKEVNLLIVDFLSYLGTFFFA